MSVAGFPNQNLIVGWVLRTVAIPNINPHQIMKTTQALTKQAMTKREEKKVVAPIKEARINKQKIEAKIAREAEEDLLKMKVQALEVKKRSAKEYESKKDQAFNFMDLAKKELKQNYFENAVGYYKEAEKIFAEMNWQEGINLIKESIDVIKIKKERIDREAKLNEAKTTEELRFGAQIQNKISRAIDLQDSQQQQRRKELLVIQAEKEIEREISEKAYNLMEEGTRLKNKKKYEEAYDKYIIGRDMFKKIGWEHEVNRINTDLLIILKKEMKQTEKLMMYQPKMVEETKELEELLRDADEKRKELDKQKKIEKLKQHERLIQKERVSANEIIKVLKYNKGSKIKNLKKGKIGNKDRIFELLKKNALTSKEIANELNLSEKNTRTYLMRLKKEGKITDIGKTGRFLIYTHKEALTPRNQRDEVVALEGDLSYLLSLIELKMTPKDGVNFTPSDLMNIRRIEERIANTPGISSKTKDVIKDLIDFEQTFKEKINEKITILEEKVDFITSGKFKSIKDEISEAKIGATDLDIEDHLTRPDSVKKFLTDSKKILISDEGITNSKEILVCNVCGAIFSYDYMYCSKCGNKLPKDEYISPQAPESVPTEVAMFQSFSSKSKIENSFSQTPFSILKREEDPIRQPITMMSGSTPKDQPEMTDRSLIGYSGQLDKTKTEKKKILKEKKKKDREKALIEKEQKSTNSLANEITTKPKFPPNKDRIKCGNCGYKMVKPFPKDQLCPKCKHFLPELFPHANNTDIESIKLEPKLFKPKTITASSKMLGVRKKEKSTIISLDDDKIDLKGGKEYVKFCGIISKDRTPLFATNKNLLYLLELTNNLDFIATSVLGGDLDKMLLISENSEPDKCQFFEKNDIIYILYGQFPDKKGTWVLEQMAKFFSELVRGKDVNNLTKLEKFDIEKKFKGNLLFIFKEYMQLEDVFLDKEIPYVDDWLRLDYIGLSSMSIGVISILLDDDKRLNVKVPGEFENPAEEIEMKESLLTAKVEAIAANTLGNTGAYPRWIAVKLGFQRYRFLTFKKYKNDYFLSCLSEGNLKKIDNIESQLEPILHHGIDTPFSGNLKSFNKLKDSIKELINQVPERKFT